MTAKRIADGLTMIGGTVNMYLIEAPEGLTLIDAGFPNSEKAVSAAIRGLGLRPSDLAHIVLTHAHPDHIGGLAALVAASGARTYMHAADIPIAERGGGFRPMTPAPGLLPALMMKLFSRPDARVAPAPIDQPIAGGDLLPIAGGLRVVHVPGHCAGQVALLWGAGRVLFTGDACANLFGLGPPIGYEDRALGERSQRELAGLDFDIACFGHGKPITRDASGRFRGAFR